VDPVSDATTVEDPTTLPGTASRPPWPAEVPLHPAHLRSATTARARDTSLASAQLVRELPQRRPRRAAPLLSLRLLPKADLPRAR
jgi:hypothetical protein